MSFHGAFTQGLLPRGVFGNWSAVVKKNLDKDSEVIKMNGGLENWTVS